MPPLRTIIWRLCQFKKLKTLPWLLHTKKKIPKSAISAHKSDLDWVSPCMLLAWLSESINVINNRRQPFLPSSKSFLCYHYKNCTNTYLDAKALQPQSSWVIQWKTTISSQPETMWLMTQDYWGPAHFECMFPLLHAAIKYKKQNCRSAKPRCAGEKTGVIPMVLAE